jgi:phospholipid/cholesterol/gamma-HCH transport system substrate-binding protein
MRRVRDRFTNLEVGVAVAIVLAPLLYLTFTKHVPFTHGYRFKAVFASALDIRSHAPVRIAGVTVGRVDSVRSYPHSGSAVVTIEMSDGGLPLHRDATLKIRPRLFLEGNFFIDVQPGTPSAPLLKQDATIPVTQTADAVQVDQVLSTLTTDTRMNLQRFLAAYGDALTAKPTPTEDAAQAPLVRGLTAAQALNRSYRDAGPALRDVAIVDQALQGTEPQDVPRLVRGLQRATAALGQDEAALQGFVSNLDTTLGAFADRSASLRRAIALLPQTLTQARSGFAALAQATGPTARFAKRFAGAVGQLPALYQPAGDWFTAAAALLTPGELGGVARDLRASAGNLHALLGGQTAFLNRADAAARCGTNVVLPTANAKLDDGPLSTGQPNYQELWRAFVGLGGTGQNFDGNGTFAHLFSPVGDTIVTSGASEANGSRGIGRAPAPPTATRPRYLGAAGRPPYRPQADCSSQPRPDVNGSTSTGPPDAATSGG